MANNPVLNGSRVLVVDDEPDLRTLYELTLLREGYRVATAESVAQAIAALRAEPFQLVLTDMRLPDGEGTEILAFLKAHNRLERSIVITAYGSAENAVTSLKAGAFDYLTKPVDLRQFRSIVASALVEGSSAKKINAPDVGAWSSHAPEITIQGEGYLGRLVGRSARMKSVRERLVKVARSMAPVMVCGESGTGKELVAQALHHCSHRAEGPWIAVNCSAIPEHLLEAEFFGSRKGAYTGATQDRPGFFLQANGGTLFLDEVGDLPLAMQAKLLRVIQERQVRALGAQQETPIDVRIVSATHKNLSAEVAAGRFRQDLYYRLHVIDIELPPLRERSEDLPDLCDAILKRIAQDSNVPARRLTERGLLRLKKLPLPGNVRELENILHRALALNEDHELDLPELDTPPLLVPTSVATLDLAITPTETQPGHLTPSLAQNRSVPGDLQAYLDQEERRILIQVLESTGFNRTLAAQRLGISLRQMRYRIDRLAIQIPGTNDAN